MVNTNWHRLEELFERVRDLPSDDRASFLNLACLDEPTLVGELHAMLAAFTGSHGLAIERFVVDEEAHDADREDPWVGKRLGSWRLTRIVGRGGMGLVYGAERADGQYQLEVAIKLVRAGPRDPYALERFATERQVLASLKHANIAGLLDSGFTPDGTPYLVMELIDGVPITDWCAARQLPLRERLRLLRIVCDAVQHAHRALVVHRDLKPSNIFVSQAGEVKLLDFGIAKLLEPEAWGMKTGETRVDMRPLTPDYAAPEQRRGEAVTTATDVYALGVLMYELVTGVRPAGPGSDGGAAIDAPSNVVSRHSGAREARRVRGDLDRIIMTALRDEPERRYASAGQLGEEIGRFLEGRAILAQPDTLGYRARKFVKRNPMAVAMAGGLMLSLAVFGVVSAWQARVLEGQRRMAQQERDTANQVVRVLVDLFETINPSIRPNGDRMPVGEFLAGAQARAMAGLGDVPHVRAKLQHVFGMIHHTRGQYGLGKQAIEAALTEHRRLAGPDAPESLESLQAFGELTFYAGDASRARLLLHESLERHARIYGGRDSRTARVLHSLAAVAGMRSDEAGDLLRRSLEIRREALGPMHRDVAESLASLAVHYTTRHDLTRAREMYLEALAVFPTPQDRRDPLAISILNDYATFLENQNEFRAAEALQREAIQVGREVLGVETFPVANLLSNLGVTQAAMGAYADAEASFRAAFESMRALLGEDHWNTTNIARNVGRTLQLQQKYVEALEWMDRASRVPEGDVRAGHWSIRAQRAALLYRVGRPDEALAEAALAVERLGQMGQEGVQALALARVMLGRILIELGRPGDAEAPLRAAAAWYDSGPDNGWRAEASCEYARARLLSGGTREDWKRLQRCLPSYRAWGLVDREVLAALERLQFQPSLATRAAAGKPTR